MTTFFCWYCKLDKPVEGRAVMRWRTGKMAGKVRGYKCAQCVERARMANLAIKAAA